MASMAKDSKTPAVLENGMENIDFKSDVHNQVDLRTPDVNYDNGQAKSDQSEFKWSNMSKRQQHILMLSVIAIFLTRVSYSILGPFYPLESEKKGMSTTVTGVVFGVFELVIFLLAPVVGTYLTRLGIKRTYVSGILLGGLCNVVFGTLYKVPNGALFIVTSVLCRAVEAVGFAAFITAGYAIVSSEFGSNVGIVFGILETGGGLGFVIGPALGVALYELGGYGLPFYFIGVMAMINAFLIFKFLPAPQQIENKHRRSIFSLFRSPLVVLPLCSVLIGVIGISIFNSTFAKHVEHFGLSTAVSSLFFIVPSVAFTLAAPLWGFITEKGFEFVLIVMGLFVFGFSFLVLGPSIFFLLIPFEVWTACIGTILVGVSLGCSFIPTIKCMVKGALELDFEDNIDTFALVSGLFNSINCLGGAIGSMTGSALVDKFDYPIAYTVFGMVSIVIGVVTLVGFSIRHFRSRSRHAMNVTGGVITEKTATRKEENGVNVGITNEVFTKF